ADAHAPFLGELVHDLDQFLAPLLREGWNRDPDDRAVTGRGETELGDHDRLLDGLGERFVPRRDGEELGFGGGDARDLIERHHVPVRVHAHDVEERRGRPAGPHARELALHRLDRFLHGRLGGLQQLGDRAHRTMVPTRSPARMRAVAPDWLMLNTTMGSRFSLHNPKAFASITAYPFTRASWKDSSGMNVAVLSFFGSAV